MAGHVVGAEDGQLGGQGWDQGWVGGWVGEELRQGRSPAARTAHAAPPPRPPMRTWVRPSLPIMEM